MDKVVNIKVVGVGGAGYSIVNRRIASGIDGVSYVTIDTCTKTERISEIHESLQIGDLNKTVLNELIDKIEVHEAEKIDGKRVQKVDIYYRFVGNLN